MKRLLRTMFKIPDKRQGTLAMEDFTYYVDKYLEENNKDGAKLDYRYLLELYRAHKDDEIERILSKL